MRNYAADFGPLLPRRDVEAELDAELREYIAYAADANVRAGMSREH